MKEVYEYLAKHKLILSTKYDDVSKGYLIYIEGVLHNQKWVTMLNFRLDEVDLLCNNQLMICQKLLYQHKQELNKVGNNNTTSNATMASIVTGMQSYSQSMSTMKEAAKMFQKVGKALGGQQILNEYPVTKQVEKQEPIYTNL